MDKQTDISICIATWNSKEQLQSCLQTLVNSKWTMSYEIIVTDNASDDGTYEMVKQNFPSVKIIRSETNLLFGGGINFAVKHANAKFIAVLNDDIYATGENLEKMCTFLNENPKIGIVGPKVLRPNGKTERFGGLFPSISVEIARILGLRFILGMKRLILEKKQVDWVSGCCFVIKREIVDEIGMFDEKYPFYWEDVDLCFRVSQAGWEVWAYPEASVTHVHAQSSRRIGIERRSQLAFEGRKVFLNKAYPIEQRKRLVKLWKIVAYRDISLLRFLLILTLGLSERTKIKLLSWKYELEGLNKIQKQLG